jgi:hypothetical protein
LPPTFNQQHHRYVYCAFGRRAVPRIGHSH